MRLAGERITMVTRRGRRTSRVDAGFTVSMFILTISTCAGSGLALSVIAMASIVHRGGCLTGEGRGGLPPGVFGYDGLSGPLGLVGMDRPYAATAFGRRAL